MPGGAELGSVVGGVRVESGEVLPEGWGMVHMDGVGEFVEQDIAGEPAGDEQELDIEADGACWRAAGPACFLAADGGSAAGQAGVVCELVEHRREVSAGLLLEPMAEHVAAEGGIVDGAGEGEVPLDSVGRGGDADGVGGLVVEGP